MLKEQSISRGVSGILVVFFLFAAACSDDSAPTSGGATTAVQLNLSGLKPLEQGFNYQAWAIQNYYVYPLGIFNFNEAGEMVNVARDSILSGEFAVNLPPDEITDIVISIEARDVMATTPAYTLILGGEVSEGQVALTVGNQLGIGVSFEGAAGKYILATPTDGAATNENSGIWFLDLSTGVSLNGFNLPELPAGWNYEGWVLVGDTYLSTGKFSQFSSVDESSDYSGSVAGPPFPGEDFLQNAPEGVSFPLDLAGASVMITVEPWNEYDDNEEKPFFLKVLAANIPPDAADHVTYDMSASNEPLPAGTATLE